MDLLVLAHARGKLGSQVNQRLLVDSRGMTSPPGEDQDMLKRHLHFCIESLLQVPWRHRVPFIHFKFEHHMFIVYEICNVL